MTSRDSILAFAAAAPSPTRAERARLQGLAAAAATAWTAAVLFLFHGVRVAPRPPALVLATGLVAAALAATALFIVATRGRDMVGRSARMLGAVALGLPVALFVWKVGASACVDGMLDRWPGRTGVRCFFVSLLAGAGPFAAVVWARRGSVLADARWTGAAIGAAVGAVGWTVNELRCQVAYLPHLLLGHLLPIVVYAALGLLAARWLAPRWVSRR